tara:strand:- start:1527 stop:3647 length:2121 start_codon:yes stop_codon:yes gene_type:complete
MAQGEKKVISRIRTYNADVSHARGEEKPAGPKLKKDKQTAQDKANAILNTPKANVIPKKAQSMKRKKPKLAHEFLSANADIPPAEAPQKKEQVPEIKKDVDKDVFAGMEEVHKPKPLPKEIKVRTSTEQKVKVADSTLSDEVRHIQEHQIQTTTFEDTPQQVSLAADDREGVIIQNKKQKRFRLLPAIGESMKSWATQKKIAATQAKEPKHVVRKADTRLDTITKAARDSFHAPQSDHGIVVKRLAKKKRVKKNTALSIKKKEETAAPSWTYTDDDASTSAPTPAPASASASDPVPTPTVKPEPTAHEEAPTPEAALVSQEVDTQLKERVVSKSTANEVHSAAAFLDATADSSAQMTQIQTPITQPVEAPTLEPAPVVTPEPAPTPEPVVTPADAPEPVPEPPEPVTPPQSVPMHTSIPAPEPILTPVSPEPGPEPVTTPTPDPVPTPKEAVPTPQEAVVPQKTQKYAPSPVDSPSRVPIYIYMLVIVGASLLGIGTSVYWFVSSTPTQEAVVITIPSLIQTNTQVPIPLSQTRDETYDNILSASLQSSETIQIYPTLKNPDGTTAPADAATVMQYMGYRAPGSFTRGIQEVTFGSVGGTDPFILMRVGNFDTAFAGMLAWEQVMSIDLAPLFGSPVSESYDPYARTDSQIRSAFFRDTIISNKSARILVDTNNTQRITYSFVQPNLILITTNTETFNTILPLIPR